MEQKKVMVIGAGAAGIMAAISAKMHHPEYDVIILEKNPVLGKKILICGAGRCNVTNSHVTLERYYGAPKKFIGTVVNQFDNRSVMDFLTNLGIELYEEEKNGRKKGKIFPITNQAATVTELLQSEIGRLGINLSFSCEVKNIKRTTYSFQLTTSESEYEADYLVVACGGKTYPRLGATGFGFEIAKQFGHSLIEPVPSALPLIVENEFVQSLAGQRVDVEVTSIISDNEIKRDTDEMMFTKYGLSGPAILNISREISVRLNRDKVSDCKLIINFFPGKNVDAIYTLLQKRWEARKNQKVMHSLFGLLPNKIVLEVLVFLGIDSQKLNSVLSSDEKKQLVNLLGKFEVDVKATKGWEEAEFTAGGIDTKEIDSTLQSKIVPNLYFAGEVLNVDGDVGGFNLSWAWSSGWVAGKLN